MHLGNPPSNPLLVTLRGGASRGYRFPMQLLRLRAVERGCWLVSVRRERLGEARRLGDPVAAWEVQLGGGSGWLGGGHDRLRCGRGWKARGGGDGFRGLHKKILMGPKFDFF